MRLLPKDISKVIWLVWLALLISAIYGVISRQWSTLFVSCATFIATLLPVIFSQRFSVKIPMGFVSVIVVFLFASLFLGEVRDFYERFWWWDILLHTGSAIGFGVIGFLFIFMLFDGDRYAAPPWALAVLSFACAVCIGALWEIFEFAMDQNFGLNMQKSGLIDTMWDLIVDSIGAFLGAFAGYNYLRVKENKGLLWKAIDSFIQLNRRKYRRAERTEK